MPHYCCVYKCTANSTAVNDTGIGRSFHKFPRDGKLRKAWLDRIRRQNFIPTEASLVCSFHFSKEDFAKSKTDTPSQFQKMRLIRTAIPSHNLRGEVHDTRQTTRKSATSVLAGNNLALTAQRMPGPSTGTKRKLFPPKKAHKENIHLSDSSEPSPISQKLNNTATEIAQLITEKLFRYGNLSDSAITSYTGLSRTNFIIIRDIIDQFQPLSYWSGDRVTKVSSEDQLLLFLMKLKLDPPYFDVAIRFHVSRTTAINIFRTYLQAAHEIFFVGCMDTIPSLEKNQCSLPSKFGDFNSCRAIIDCTEIRIESPRQDLNAAASTYSNYKHALTVKYLIAVAPNGAITFVSDGYPGSISDKEITAKSGLITHLQAGDLLLADKGFLIYDLLPRGIYLNLPSFLSTRKQFTKEEAAFTRRIARSRIHVERGIERMRNYKILHCISAPMRPYIDKIVQVCALLVNFQSPTIAGVFDSYCGF